jgi:hypothetical protein
MLGLAAAGCKTINEELPTRPSSTTGGVPVVTVPVPVQVTPVTLPAPQATPTPSSPNAPSEPTPDEGGGTDIDPFIPDNDNPVAKAIAKVYFVECLGAAVPGSELATEAPVGCRVHLDVTPKDSGGHPTRTKHDPAWHYSNPGLFDVQGPSAFNPVLLVQRPGSTSVYAVVDGVQSNSFNIRFK